MNKMLVMSPLGHALQLTPCGDNENVFVERPIEINLHQAKYTQMLAENNWLVREGFVELAIGSITLEPNPELEAL